MSPHPSPHPSPHQSHGWHDPSAGRFETDLRLCGECGCANSSDAAALECPKQPYTDKNARPGRPFDPGKQPMSDEQLRKIDRLHAARKLAGLDRKR